jgi:hypothetical protein
VDPGPVAGRGAYFHWHTYMDKTDDRVVITQLNGRSSPSAIPVVSQCDNVVTRGPTYGSARDPRNGLRC